jgi:hypothetical protein
VVIVGVAQDQPVAMGKGHILSAAHHGREKRVGHVRNNHPDHAAFFAT